MTDEKRGAAARQARHLNALRRKAPAMVEALRELGYVVIAPEDLPVLDAPTLKAYSFVEQMQAQGRAK